MREGDGGGDAGGERRGVRGRGEDRREGRGRERGTEGEKRGGRGGKGRVFPSLPIRQNHPVYMLPTAAPRASNVPGPRLW